MTDTTPPPGIVDAASAANPDASMLAASDAEARVVALENQARRSRADYENLHNRFDREVARERSAERASVASAWLPVVDDLERALEYAGADPGSLIDGVRSIRDQALAVLTGLGYHRFEDVGEPFDPNRHEAMGTVDAHGPAGSVAVLVRAGYGNEREVLRPAGVLVCSGSVS